MQINIELLKRRRKELKLRLVEVGRAVGVDKAMICLYESGKVTPPIKHLPLYAKALNLPEQALVIFEN
jgi:transcriptional regulator with XRE-family HTH domain